MPSTEQQLRDALIEFMRAAGGQSDISAALKKITELQTRLGPSAHPMLRHYLERRSYQKALDFLNTGVPEAEKPQCGQKEKDEERKDEG